MPFKRILCAVDFSEQSEVAFRKAIKIAKLVKGRLFVVHALEAQPVISRLMPHDGLGEMTLKLEHEAKEAMDSFIGDFQEELGEIPLETQISSGRAFEEILENARVWNIDLIVLGTKSATSLEMMVLGSTTELVVKACDCSVLVVK